MNSDTSLTVDQAFEKLSKTALRVKAERDELLKCLKAIMKRIEDGDLVRGISKDHRSDWPIQMMYFVKELQEAQTAIAKAERPDE